MWACSCPVTRLATGLEFGSCSGTVSIQLNKRRGEERKGAMGRVGGRWDGGVGVGVGTAWVAGGKARGVLPTLV